MTFVGVQRFLHHRQREDIRATLEAEHGLRLSSGETSVPAHDFVVYLEALHQAHLAKKAARGRSELIQEPPLLLFACHSISSAECCGVLAPCQPGHGASFRRSGSVTRLMRHPLRFR
jgi:hypothetical protein